jgi:hypothetical protein
MGRYPNDRGQARFRDRPGWVVVGPWVNRRLRKVGNFDRPVLAGDVSVRFVLEPGYPENPVMSGVVDRDGSSVVDHPAAEFLFRL